MIDATALLDHVVDEIISRAKAIESDTDPAQLPRGQHSSGDSGVANPPGRRRCRCCGDTFTRYR